MHLHTVYMEYSECLPTLLNPLAERTCFSQVPSPLTNEVGSHSLRSQISAEQTRRAQVRKTSCRPRSWATSAFHS